MCLLLRSTITSSTLKVILLKAGPSCTTSHTCAYHTSSFLLLLAVRDRRVWMLSESWECDVCVSGWRGLFCSSRWLSSAPALPSSNTSCRTKRRRSSWLSFLCRCVFEHVFHVFLMWYYPWLMLVCCRFWLTCPISSSRRRRRARVNTLSGGRSCSWWISSAAEPSCFLSSGVLIFTVIWYVCLCVSVSNRSIRHLQEASNTDGKGVFDRNCVCRKEPFTPGSRTMTKTITYSSQRH